MESGYWIRGDYPVNLAPFVNREGLFCILGLPLAKPNLTGRFFMCLKSNDNLVDSFENSFVAGQVYKEAIIDPSGDNLSRLDNEVFLLYSEDEIVQYVNKEGFELVSKKIQLLEEMTICMN